jgi:dUTP pyrophosphatase
MAKFEKVSKFSDVDINLPMRKTAYSAGYDFEVAEDIIIPSYPNLMEAITTIIP